MSSNTFVQNEKRFSVNCDLTACSSFIMILGEIHDLMYWNMEHPAIGEVNRFLRNPSYLRVEIKIHASNWGVCSSFLNECMNVQRLMTSFSLLLSHPIYPM
jgi:hypothetical protein